MIKSNGLRIISVLFVLTLAAIMYWGYEQFRDEPVKEVPAVSKQLTLLADRSWVDKPYLMRAIELFKQETGIHVAVEAVPSNSAMSIIKKKFAVNVLPDITMFYGGAQMETFHPSQTFVKFSGEAWQQQLKPFVMPQISSNQEVYGFPLWEDEVQGIIYNKQLLKELGIDALPTDSEQFFQLCQRLMEAEVSPFYFDFIDSWPDYIGLGLSVMEPLYPDMVQRLNRNQLAFEEMPDMETYLNWYHTLAERGFLGPSYMNNGIDGRIAALMNKRYAMAIGSDSDIRRMVEDGAPEEQFGLMPFYFGFNDGVYVRNNLILMYLNANSGNVTAAEAFVRLAAENLDVIYGDGISKPVIGASGIPSTNDHLHFAEGVLEGRPVMDAVSPLITGFLQEEIPVPIQEMMLGRQDAAQAVQALDQLRKQYAKLEGKPGF